ncbi:MAG TPA: STAS domain-containing protein [Terriglobia bacterium]|nr:STAS domain-containing protein [Terriglobia bacterium]
MHIQVPVSYELAAQIPSAESAVDFHFRHAGKYVVFDIEGPLTFRWVADELCFEVRRMIADGRKELVIDLAAVPFVDSAGIGALAATLNLIQASGGKLVLLSAQHRVLDMFSRLRLTRFFTFSNDRTLAFTRS